MSGAQRHDLGGLERAIGHVLRFGTMASSVCLALGLIMSFAGVASGFAEPLLKTGLVVLLATPVARVVVSVVEYAREQDWVFVALTLVVLLALGGSVVAAFW